MQIAVVKMFGESGRIATAGFDDIVNPVVNALTRLGHKVSQLENTLSSKACNIIFGAHLYSDALREARATDIIVNLEQWHNKSPFFTQDYLELLSRTRVFEYSKRNAKYLLREHGIKTEFFRIGYDPLQSVLSPDYPQDIDVLFYGSMNQRRARVLRVLRERGLRVVNISGTFGKERDQFIQRAKLILNVQYYDNSSLEIVRLSYLFSNRKAVISERSSKTYLYPELNEACAFSPYEALPDAVCALLANKNQLHRTGEAGFEAFSSWTMDETLRELIGANIHSDTNPLKSAS